MKVRATREGFYGLIRRWEGDEFEMADEHYCPKKSDGKPYVDRKGNIYTCSWVVALEAPEKEAKPEKVSKPKAAKESKKESKEKAPETGSNQEVI